jgi:hypothetical protein
VEQKWTHDERLTSFRFTTDRVFFTHKPLSVILIDAS